MAGTAQVYTQAAQSLQRLHARVGQVQIPVQPAGRTSVCATSRAGPLVENGRACRGLQLTTSALPPQRGHSAPVPDVGIPMAPRCVRALTKSSTN